MPRKPADAFGDALRRLGQSQEVGTAFLTTDLNLAMTLVRIAQCAAEESESRNRNKASARHANDDLSRIASHASIKDDNDRQTVTRNWWNSDQH